MALEEFKRVFYGGVEDNSLIIIISRGVDLVRFTCATLMVFEDVSV